MNDGKLDTEPLVSVIIPTYNRREYIGEALDSVISQTYRNLEIIIIDDGSTDNTKEYVETHYRELIESGTIRYIYKEHSGISESRNAGIRNSFGSLLAFIDSDDIWDKDKLRLQVDYLNDHPDCSIVSTLYSNFFDDAMLPMTEESIRILNEKRSKQCFASICCRKAVFQICGLMDPSLSTGEDVEWTFRTKCFRYEIGVIEQELYFRRVHNHNISCNDRFCSEESYRESIVRAFHNHHLNSRSKTPGNN